MGCPGRLPAPPAVLLYTFSKLIWSEQVNKKPARKFDRVLIIGYIVVVLIHLIGYLVTKTTPDMSQLELQRMGVIKVFTGLLGIASIIAMYIITVIRTGSKIKCPACGAKVRSASETNCEACGTLLVNG